MLHPSWPTLLARGLRRGSGLRRACGRIGLVVGGGGVLGNVRGWLDVNRPRGLHHNVEAATCRNSLDARGHSIRTLRENLGAIALHVGLQVLLLALQVA